MNPPRDIAEPADRARQNLLGAAADVLPQLLAVVGPDGRILASNAAWRERAPALGLVPDAAVGDDYLAACAAAGHGSAAQRLGTCLRHVLAGQASELASEERFQGAEEECWMLCRVQGFRDGDAGAAVVSLVDITPRKRTEMELARRSALLAEAEHIALLGSWEWDVRTDKLTWSDEHYRMLGLEPGTFEPTFELALNQLTPAEAGRVRRAMERAIADKADHVLEYTAVHKVTGATHTFVSKGRVVLDERGEVVRLVGTAQDITAPKALEESLRESELMMRELLEERQQLARDLHDGIIQMLYAVGMMLEDAQRQLAVAPQSVAERIERAIGDLNRVIRDVRRHIIGVESAPMTGQQLRAELAKLVQAMDVSPELRFTLRIDPAAAGRLGPEQANHVLYVAREAMSNALRHARARNGSVALSLHDQGVRLQVIDDGAGFDSRPTREAGGLHNMSTRARQLGARLDVSSQPGYGTRVTLDLPKETIDGGG